ncbi:MAG: hypothetical protein A3B11_00320 [Candidatus Taylorbacteria bacterium RIFCSPLOWO2_01_FULL_44_26]|uniref:Uncharacterized protein n=2 Tax=Candidatus Tayloriibacteriota TaxID=1817919 RepID=A0A1G2MJ91_9BACT|nr:MAG: hypothetical protein A3D50_02465 [Candidatus Taylorbacteria bacterium RIFCSPHIGHO2_02_FULL_44_12]OHA31133.1 MAG: hypothetical protein A3B11_00320 [Candidatus Taylorbacteria bacterium RIFCSPLOWO2_01_FULL_44_26]
MGTKVLVGGSTVSASQMKDFWRQIDDGSINGINFQRFLDHQDPFALEAVVIDWDKVYKLLGMSNEFERSNILVKPESGFWDVCVIHGVTMNKVVGVLRSLGVAMSLYAEDLDGNVPTNDRNPANGSYCVRFQKTVEADPELKGKSAKVLMEEGIKGTTLLERLLLELGYFLATGSHLDQNNITLCSNSRYSDGDVPGVFWYSDDREVYVYWFSPSSANPCLRARAVVS